MERAHSVNFAFVFHNFAHKTHQHRSRKSILLQETKADTFGSHSASMESYPIQKPTSQPKTSVKGAQPSPPTESVLYLEKSPITFDPPSQRVSVFFDECNREVISLTICNDSKTKVIFQSTDSPRRLEFVLPVEKRILSIKLNPQRSILAYHVEKSNIEFFNVQRTTTAEGNVSHSLEERRYVQASRTKNSKLFGFLWTGESELVMITDISIEYYHVEATRRRLRLIKSFSSSTNWFVYQPSRDVNSTDLESQSQSYSVLMISTGSIGNSIQPYLFSRGQITKLQRFDVEGAWHGSEKLELFERSITIASIYGQVRLLVLQHESLNVKSKGAQILVYTVNIDTGSTNITHTLDLDVNGRFAINILDNLVIAHDQPSKSSFIFDLMIESTQKSDCPRHYVSLLGRQPLKFRRSSEDEADMEMYSLNWVFFQPNFIIEARLGLLSTVHIDLNLVREVIEDELMLLTFLAFRSNSEQIILNKCKQIVSKSYAAAVEPLRTQGSPLADVSAAFELLSSLVISAPQIGKDSAGGNIRSETSEEITFLHPPSISQDDIYHVVFKQLESMDMQSPAHLHFVTSALLDFIFFVRNRGKSIEFCIYELLLKFLVRGRRYYQLVQMLRAEIFEDSKQVACLLLSLRKEFRPAAQLGLDMLHRLDCLTDLIESLSLTPEPSAQSSHSETVSRVSMIAPD